MNVREWIRRYRLKVTALQVRAMLYLEARGQRMGVQFGTDNAIDKAREDWMARKARSSRFHRASLQHQREWFRE